MLDQHNRKKAEIEEERDPSDKELSEVIKRTTQIEMPSEIAMDAFNPQLMQAIENQIVSPSENPVQPSDNQSQANGNIALPAPAPNPNPPQPVRLPIEHMMTMVPGSFNPQTVVPINPQTVVPVNTNPPAALNETSPAISPSARVEAS